MSSIEQNEIVKKVKQAFWCAGSVCIPEILHMAISVLFTKSLLV